MIAAAAAVVALLAAPTVASLPVSGGGQVTVSAKQFKYNFGKQRIEYTGDPVRFTRGDSKLTCKQLVAQLDKAGDVTDATCTGDVRFERADKVVTCEKAVYQAGAQRLTCEGNPTIKSPEITATGDLLTYDLANDEVTMEGPHGVVPAEVAETKQQQLQQHRKQKRGGPK